MSPNVYLWTNVFFNRENSLIGNIRKGEQNRIVFFGKARTSEIELKIILRAQKVNRTSEKRVSGVVCGFPSQSVLDLCESAAKSIFVFSGSPSSTKTHSSNSNFTKKLIMNNHIMGSSL